jgi:hypothetical protein
VDEIKDGRVANIDARLILFDEYWAVTQSTSLMDVEELSHNIPEYSRPSRCTKNDAKFIQIAR